MALSRYGSGDSQGAREKLEIFIDSGVWEGHGMEGPPIALAKFKANNQEQACEPWKREGARRDKGRNKLGLSKLRSRNSSGAVDREKTGRGRSTSGRQGGL